MRGSWDGNVVVVGGSSSNPWQGLVVVLVNWVVPLRRKYTSVDALFCSLFEVVTRLHLLIRHQLLPTSHHLVVMLPGPGTRSLAGWGPVRTSFVNVLSSCCTSFNIRIT